MYQADVYQVGPWFVDVRQGVQGDKVVTRSGFNELERYLTFATAAGHWTAGAAGEGGTAGASPCALCNAEYTKKLPAPGESTEPFGWLCNMTVVRLPAARGGGCLLYSPILDQRHTIDGVLAGLEERGLLPVRVLLAPSPQHHLALYPYQKAFPDALLLCGKASGPLVLKKVWRKEVY